MPVSVESSAVVSSARALAEQPEPMCTRASLGQQGCFSIKPSILWISPGAFNYRVKQKRFLFGCICCGPRPVTVLKKLRKVSMGDCENMAGKRMKT